MHFKTDDVLKNERLELLMQAVGNQLLEGELCPNCYEQCSSPEFKKITQSVLKSINQDETGKSKIRDALDKINAYQNESVLTVRENSDELVKEYICVKCHRSYVGELNLIANLSETKVLSFFGYDPSKRYTKDFYSFSLIDESYDSFVKELWEAEIEDSAHNETLTPRMMQETTEDAISGEVIGMLKRFFVKFSRAVHQEIGADVSIYSNAHAGAVEAGKRQGNPASGADIGIWIGPMTKDDSQMVKAYLNKEVSELPVLIGNGVILQAKKEHNGKIDRKQIRDLINYASIQYKNHEYFGVPGKLFMNYSAEPPFITVLSCDFTYQLYEYSQQLPEGQNFISFPTSLKKFAEYRKPLALPEFVQEYLSGKIGTPLLMLEDIFATPGPKLVVGLPPELLKSLSSRERPPLASAVARTVAALGARLEAIHAAEAQISLREQAEAQLHAQQHAEHEQERYYAEQLARHKQEHREQQQHAEREQEQYYAEQLARVEQEQRREQEQQAERQRERERERELERQREVERYHAQLAREQEYREQQRQSEQRQQTNTMNVRYRSS